MNNDQKIQQLETQVQELLKWKEDRIRQQITYPLDQNSILCLNKYFLRIISNYIEVAGPAGREFKSFIVQQDLDVGTFADFKAVKFSANATSNVLTLISGIVPIHSFADTDQVRVFTSDTLPSPLDNITTYFVRDSTGTTFKLALTSGGTAIDITDAGTGIHYVDYL